VLHDSIAEPLTALEESYNSGGNCDKARVVIGFAQLT
jgi:hypothetical protein